MVVTKISIIFELSTKINNNLKTKIMYTREEVIEEIGYLNPTQDEVTMIKNLANDEMYSIYEATCQIMDNN